MLVLLKNISEMRSKRRGELDVMFPGDEWKADRHRFSADGLVAFGFGALRVVEVLVSVTCVFLLTVT